MCVNEDRCVICGEYVPEGRMVCIKCEEEANMKRRKPKRAKEDFNEGRRKKLQRGKIRLEEMDE